MVLERLKAWYQALLDWVLDLSDALGSIVARQPWWVRAIVTALMLGLFFSGLFWIESQRMPLGR